MNDERGFDTAPVAWHWHLYRPEALMVYLLIGLGIFFYFYEQDDLRMVRLVPLDDGSALAMGFDDRDGPEGNLKIWRTGFDERAEWITDLDANFIPSHRPNADWPICTTIENRAYLLQGQRSEGGGKLLGLACINLEDGALEWENWEHPTGDAEFGSVFAWKNQLVTTHRTKRNGEEKLYVVGREIIGGAMTWTQVYNMGNEPSKRPWQSRFSLMPNMILVEENQLSILSTQNGDVLHNWDGNSPYHTGGWIFYQDSSQVRALSMLEKWPNSYNSLNPQEPPNSSSKTVPTGKNSHPDPAVDTVRRMAFLEDTHIRPRAGYLSEDSLLFPTTSGGKQPGFSGFYRGFPFHLNTDGLHLKFQDSILFTPLAFEISTSPNGTLPPNLTTRPGFLNEDLPRFIPLMGKFAQPDSLRLAFPQLTEGRSLSGERFVWLNMEKLGPVSISKELPADWAKGQFTTWEGYHYYLGAAIDQPNQPLVLKFNGYTGQLEKAVQSTFNVKELQNAYPHQPIGNRIWFAGSKEWGALNMPDLELTFTTNDSIRFKDVTANYKMILGN